MLDLGQLSRRQWLEMGKVETQLVRGNQGTLLLHMGAQQLTQRCMQEMGRRVIEDDCRATRRIHVSAYPITHLQGATGKAADMAVELARIFKGVRNVESRTCCSQHADVTDLSTGFGIERRAIQYHYSLLALPQHFHGAATLEQGHYLQVCCTQ